MKRCCAAEPSGITGPAHTPPPSVWVGCPVSSSGLPLMAVGRAGGSRSRALAASAWLEQGSSGMLVFSSASVCLSSCGARCSVSFPGLAWS